MTSPPGGAIDAPYEPAGRPDPPPVATVSLGQGMYGFPDAALQAGKVQLTHSV